MSPGGHRRPDLGALLDFLRGHLPSDEVDRIRSLLDDRPELIDDLAWLRRLDDVGTSIPLPDLEARLEARLESLGPDPEPRLVLVADSREAPPLAGMRGTVGTAGDWTMLLASNDHDLLLEVAIIDDDRVSVRGELLAAPGSVERWSMQLSTADATIPTVARDAAYEAERVPRSIVRLEVDVDAVVASAELDLGW
ncbi:MAG: hypothetical protein AAGA99_12425 [Actinomycetota bacterium]